MRKLLSIKNICKKVQKTGFTLIELIVVVAIIAMVSTLVIFNNAKLNSALLLSNTSYEIGLMVREAQTAGLGVRATDNSSVQDFTYSQGVHFDIAYPNQAILFSDKDSNGYYNGSEENVQIYTISNSRAGKILALCGVEPSELSNTCVAGISNSIPVSESTTQLDILFKRPNPEAFFKKVKNDGSGNREDWNNPVVINIGFEGDICRSIVVQKTGAVQVDSSYCVPTTAN